MPLFDVPGWDVPASALKIQTESNDGTYGTVKAHKKSKKRKRSNNGVNVTHDNVGDLYTSVIEGKANDFAKPHAAATANSTLPDEKTRGKKKRKDKHKKLADLANSTSDPNVLRIFDQIEQGVNRTDTSTSKGDKFRVPHRSENGNPVEQSHVQDQHRSVGGLKQANGYPSVHRSEGVEPAINVDTAERNKLRLQGRTKALAEKGRSPSPHPAHDEDHQQRPAAKHGSIDLPKTHLETRDRGTAYPEEVLQSEKQSLERGSLGKVCAESKDENGVAGQDKANGVGHKQKQMEPSATGMLDDSPEARAERTRQMKREKKKMYKAAKQARSQAVRSEREDKQDTVESDGKRQSATAVEVISTDSTPQSAEGQKQSPAEFKEQNEQLAIDSKKLWKKKNIMSTKDDNSSRAQLNPPASEDVAAAMPKPNAVDDSPGHAIIKKLTPMQQKMEDRLISARFRTLNEQLYTSPSSTAANLFLNESEAYETYHSGFRAQVRAWPSNPLDCFIAEIRNRANLRPGRLQNREGKTQGIGLGPLPRDRRTGYCRIADLGCGDARLASSLAPIAKTKNSELSITSFDLARPKGPSAMLVTKADITNLSAVGVRDGSFDTVICCLSLMSSNWVAIVDECSRILVKGGEVWVAEVKSRFRRKGETAKLQSSDKKRKGGKRNRAAEDEEEGEADWREELEEKKDDDQTDTTPFLHIWQKRGFELTGQIDTSNKMFVSMKFVKTGRSPPKTHPKGQMWGPGVVSGGKKRRFADVQGEGDREREIMEEGKVLKPCLYKTR